MNTAIILLAGKGTRMNYGDKPKQFLDVNGKPLIIHTIEKFEKNLNIDQILLVASKEYLKEVSSLIKKYDLRKIISIIEGGATRQDSVYNGLEYLKKHQINDDDIVLIHDGARVLVSDQVITDNIEKCKIYSSVGTVIPSTDTIFKSKDFNSLYQIENREELFLVQTPQTFKFKIIHHAHHIARLNHNYQFTDDCSLVFNDGARVFFTLGSRLNFKVTTYDDYLMLKAIINMKI